jgi:foldase protein PrsA
MEVATVNQSKKTIKNQNQIKKPDKKHVHDPKRTKIWIITSAILAVVLISGLLFDQLYKSTIITINGDKYHMKDLNYYFYSVESQYAYYDQMFSGQYWDMSYDTTSGTTMRDIAKQEAIDRSLYYEIMYREALAKNYSLTEEEKNTIATNVTNNLGTMSNAVKKKNGFNEAYLTKIFNKTTLVDRYRKDVVNSLDIDDESIKAGIKYEDYRQYDIEYLVVSTKTTDDNGNTVDLSAEEKAAAKDKISSVYDKALTTADWSTLVPKEDTQLKYQKDNFVKDDGKFDTNFETMMMSMDNNKISAVYEAEDGYYIVRMLNNNSTESYDKAVQDAITNAENEGFQKYYEGVQENYKYTINNNALNSLTMGKITLAD